MPDGRGFFSSDKEIFRSHTDVWQGKATPYGGKKAAQTAFNGCEYRFLTGEASHKRRFSGFQQDALAVAEINDTP